jgi:Uroporphyrinogen-III decarboxylase
MTSKERVRKTLIRQKADRPASSLRCTGEVWEALMKHFDVKNTIDVLDKLDIDLRWLTSLSYIGPQERSTPTLHGEGTDIWGNVMRAARNEYNTYYEIVGHPLAKCETVEEVMMYDWPSLDWWDYSSIKSEIKANKKTDDRAIMFFAGGAFETPWYMRGMEQFLVDLYENPDIVDAICFKVREYYFNRAMRVLDAADGEIDIIGSGGDIGGQEHLMLSPDLWRKMIKPHSAGLISPFKKMGLGTFYHSCGSVAEVVDDFIGIGLDLLDPIQVSAGGMQPEILFGRFGDRISFHGAIDEVGLLPNASPKDVYNETARIISILGGNGGYIVSPTHQVQGDTSVENVIAIFNAVKDYKY